MGGRTEAAQHTAAAHPIPRLFLVCSDSRKPLISGLMTHWAGQLCFWAAGELWERDAL